MEQRAQLTQNEVQWYKYLNYTARAYLHGWQAVTFPVGAVYLETRGAHTAVSSSNIYWLKVL